MMSPLATLNAGVLLALLAFAGYQWHEAGAQHAAAQLMQRQRDAARQALDQSTQARAEESRRAHVLQEALDAEHLARQTVEADARRADAAAVGLRQRAQQLAAAARCPTSDLALAGSGPAASAPGDLLADMLSRLDEAAGAVGRYADDARLAGQLCERAYDALTPR